MYYISIIVPIYNVQNYLYECLESLVKQDLENIEIILINDGSTDNSRVIAEQFQKQYKNIKLLNKNNEGLAPTRNYGISLASGKYIMFIDSDDMLNKNVLKDIYNSINKNDYDILIFNGKSFTDNKISNDKYFNINQEVNSLTNNDKIKKIISLHSACFKLYSMKFIKENNIMFYNENLYGEDVYFWIKCLNKIEAERVGYIDKEVYLRRYREGSIMTSNHKKNYLDRIKKVDELFKLANNKIIENYIFNYIFNIWSKAIEVNKELGKDYFDILQNKEIYIILEKKYKFRINIYKTKNRYIIKIYEKLCKIIFN